MPRTGRGGARQGQAGQAYGNRSDLSMDAAPAEGREFGARQRDLDAQQAVPMSPPPHEQAQPAPGPGELGPLAGDTQRPDEPVTAGAALGTGPGPEALSRPGARFGRPAPRTPLQQLAEQLDDPYLRSLARFE